jgi:SAM-dependent methyltransferase
MNTVNLERWQSAQKSESQYWDGMNVPELLRIFAEKPAFLEMIDAEVLVSLFDDKEVLEIGVGPLGVSLASFYPHKDKIKHLTKVEPLPQIALSESLIMKREAWAKTFLEWVKSISNEGDYVQASGENLNYSQQFDTVIIYNVLDHVQEPKLILKNAYEALKDSGYIFIGVDCRSIIGRLKFEYYLRNVAKGEILVEAHPHTFLPGHVVSMLEDVGFTNVQCIGVPGAIKKFIGSSFRPAFIARKS